MSNFIYGSGLKSAVQARHTALVTELLMSACGDLMLDRRGDLCTRNCWASDGLGNELPFDQHKPGNKLAVITRDGWVITGDGAQFILENCPPESRRRADIRLLESVVRDAHNAMIAKLAGEG